MSTSDFTSTQKPKIALLIDTPDCSWDTSSAGLLYGIQVWASLIESVDACQLTSDRICRDLVPAMAPPLLLITHELGASMIGNADLEDAVADVVATATKDESPGGE